MLKYGTNYLLWLAIMLSSITTTSLARGRNLLPRGLHIGFDVLNPVYYRWKEKTGDQYNIQATVDFKRILLEGAYGWGTMKRRNPPDKPFAYSANQGNYWSMGIAYNFLHSSQEKNLAFLGLRYSRAYFTDQLLGKLQDESVKTWNKKLSANKPSPDVIAEKHTFKANWLELTAGARVHIWWWLYGGTTIYYRFAKDITLFDVHTPFDIIGWGLNEEEDTWGIHYYIALHIPFQANSKPTPQKK
jgi:hypothetical protein